MSIAIKFVLLAGMLGGVQSQACAQNKFMVESYVWKNRIVLLFAPNADNDLLQQQYVQLQADARGLSERDIVLFRVLSDQVKGQDTMWDTESSATLRDQYRVGNEAFCVILIGKDGSEKLRKNELLPQEELYSVIDAMPMRRREMREDKD